MKAILQTIDTVLGSAWPALTCNIYTLKTQPLKAHILKCVQFKERR